MREFKIFLVVACFTALVYWGVEPYAHSVLKPHTTPANFNFELEDVSFAESIVKAKEAEESLAKEELNKLQAKLKNNQSFEEIKAALEPINAQIAELENESSKEAEASVAKLQKDNAALFELSAAYAKVASATAALENAKANLEENKALWAEVAKIDLSKGDANLGKEIFASSTCIGCHGAEIDGLAMPITSSEGFGTIPPDLSSAGLIYDEKFLAALMINPSLALKINNVNFSMTPHISNEGTEEATRAEIAHIIAYFKELGARYASELENNATAVAQAKFANFEGSEANKLALIQKDLEFAKDKDAFIQSCGRCHDMKYDSFITPSNPNDLKGYLASIPPDLSMMIRSRGDEYLHNFINNTQKLLPGTAMPRVGLNEATQNKVVSYMEKVGDSKKDERESLGIYIMIFFVILSVFAIGWKKVIWAKLH